MIDRYIELNKEDILYFLHIPKTAGITFTTMLEDHFDYDSIYHKRKYDELISGLPTDFSKFKLFSGHFGYGFYRILPKKPIYLTMLRDPIERTISNFEHNLRIQRPDVVASQEKIRRMSIIFHEKTFRKHIYKDTMTYHLGLDFDAAALVKSIKKKDLVPPIPGMLTLPYWLSNYTPDEIALEFAKKNLKEFAFFGLSERFQESMFLLYYTFGWKPQKNMLKLNEASSRLQTKDLPENITHLISELTSLDAELYRYAEGVFNDRFSKMVESLKKKYYKSKFEKEEFKDVLFDMLSSHHEETVAKSQNNSPNLASKTSMMDYDFKKPINGVGWYSREVSSNGEVFRWTGPETTTFIDFPLESDTDMSIEVKVINCLDESIISSLTIKANDQPISFKISELKTEMILTGVIAKEVILGKGNVRLTFEIDKTISPKSLDPKSTDTRRLGLAIERIKIKPIDAKYHSDF